MRDKGVQNQAQNNVQTFEAMVGEATRQAVYWFKLFVNYYKALFLEESYASQELVPKISYAQEAYNASKSIVTNVKLDNVTIPKRYSFIMVPAPQVIDLRVVYNKNREFFSRLILEHNIDSVRVFEKKKVINFYSKNKWVYGIGFLLGNVLKGLPEPGGNTGIAGFEETL